MTWMTSNWNFEASFTVSYIYYAFDVAMCSVQRSIPKVIIFFAPWIFPFIHLSRILKYETQLSLYYNLAAVFTIDQ